MLKILKVILLFFAVWIAIPWLFGFALKKVEIDYPFDLVITNEFIILISSLVFIMREKNVTGENPFKREIRPGHFFRILYLTFILQCVTIVGVIVLIIYSAPLPNFVYSESLAFIAVKYVVFIPLCEEIFLRLLIQPRLSFLTGVITIWQWRLTLPVLITALLFGVMHLLPWRDTLGAIKDFISVFILALIAGYYREKVGSFFPAYIAHASYNFWGAVVTKVLYLSLK